MHSHGINEACDFTQIYRLLPDMMSRLCITLYIINRRMFLTACWCCYTWHPSPANHSCFRSSDGFQLSFYESENCIVVLYSDTTQHSKYYQNTSQPPFFRKRWIKRHSGNKNLEKMIYDTAKCWPNHRDADSHGTNIITGPRCSVKYDRSFAGEFLLYKWQTCAIRTGLRSQTTSAIITND